MTNAYLIFNSKKSTEEETLGETAFSNCFALTNLTICDGVTNIGSAAFRDCSSLTSVYYGGSETDWSEISIAAENGDLKNATICFNE